MYIWGEKVAGRLDHTESRRLRIRMLAGAADYQGIGRWQSYTLNLVEGSKRGAGQDDVDPGDDGYERTAPVRRRTTAVSAQERRGSVRKRIR